MHSLTQGTQFVGIDVSARRLDVYLHPNDDSFTVTHDRAGMWELVSRLSAFESSLIVLEPTGGFERDVADLLAETGFDIAIVIARQIRVVSSAVSARFCLGPESRSLSRPTDICAAGRIHDRTPPEIVRPPEIHCTRGLFTSTHYPRRRAGT